MAGSAQVGGDNEEVHLSEHAATRLYIPRPLTAGAAVALDTAQSHRLRNVLRLDAGAAVAAFNERDGEWLCRLTPQGRRGATLLPEQRLQAAEAEPDLWLLFAPIRRARLDWLVEKATELGVARLLPVQTRRTIVERVNLERLRANAVEAAEQTERLSVPDLADPQPLDKLMARWPASRRLLLCDESGASPPIAETLGNAVPGAWAVMVGPEGGFAETELDALKKLPFVSPVGLGPRVLRADTAALAALAVLQALAGDWRTPRRR